MHLKMLLKAFFLFKLAGTLHGIISKSMLLKLQHIFICFYFILVLLIKADTYEKCNKNDCSGKEACATIYQHRNFGGWHQCLTFRNDECIKLNDWWISQGSRVSGVHSHDTCIRLHERRDCSGFSLEIKPGGHHHDYLNNLDFEDTAKSVSSCKRAPIDKQCSVRVLFSRNIETEKVSIASEQILGVLDSLASLASSGFSAVIPGLDVFYSGLKFVTGLFNSEKSTEALIDAKIDEAFARNSASQISAKMHVINNRLQSLLSSTTPAGDRRIDLGLALHTCEEVKKLFEDNNYSFSKNRVVSSPYLVVFSSVYLSIAKLVHEMRPELRLRVAKDMNELTRLNKRYLEEAVKQRKEKFTWDYFPNGYILEDRLVCEPGKIGGGRRASDCYQYRSCRQWKKCEKCLTSIKSSIEMEIESFFRPVINMLEKFP